MNEEEKIDPRHSSTRNVLRILGPAIAGMGLLLTLIGVGSFFAAFGSFEMPRYFWCAFLGLPLLAVGMAISGYAFMGRVYRYQAGEIAPVQKDTFNYLAEGTKDGVKGIATAIGEGVAAGMGSARARSVRCGKCNHENEPDARFCKNCGRALSADRP